jgi:hypothetical protein
MQENGKLRTENGCFDSAQQPTKIRSVSGNSSSVTRNRSLRLRSVSGKPAFQSPITNQKSPVTSIQFFCAIRLSYKKRNRVSAEKSLGVRFLLPPIFQRGGPGWGWLFIYKSPIKNLRSPRYIPTRYQYSSLQKCGEACRNTRRPKKLLFNQKSPIKNP